jgi:hypothetical protein
MYHQTAELALVPNLITWYHDHVFEQRLGPKDSEASLTTVWKDNKEVLERVRNYSQDLTFS